MHGVEGDAYKPNLAYPLMHIRITANLPRTRILPAHPLGDASRLSPHASRHTLRPHPHILRRNVTPPNPIIQLPRQISIYSPHFSKTGGLTNNSFGFFLKPGSLRKQSSTKTCASLGNLSTGTSRGAGSLTMYCRRSRIDIVGPAAAAAAAAAFAAFWFAGFPRAVVRNSRGRSESSGDVGVSAESESEKGKRPRASSMRLIPNDQISDLTEYSPPWIRSGYHQEEG